MYMYMYMYMFLYMYVYIYSIHIYNNIEMPESKRYHGGARNPLVHQNFPYIKIDIWGIIAPFLVTSTIPLQ
jgi:hypothetical protein